MKKEAPLVHIWGGMLNKGRAVSTEVSMGAVLINERLIAGEPGGQGMEDSGF